MCQHVRNSEGQGGVHLCPFFWRDAGNCGVLKDAPVEELHDVEVAANDALILAERVGFRHWDIGLLKGVDDSVFTIYLVRRLKALVRRLPLLR